MKITEFSFINKAVLLQRANKERLSNDRILRYVWNITEEEAIERVIKDIKNNPSSYHAYKCLSEEELRQHIYVRGFAGPDNYPKYNNEMSFVAFGKYVNPEIVGIRWNGPYRRWEYQLKNIGHIGGYECYEENLKTIPANE